jgi:hypothetical protein
MDLLNNYYRPKASFLALFLGIAVMLLANVLWLEFSIHPKPAVMGLSCLFALVVFSDRSIHFVLSLFYFCLMSIFIFLVAVGANQSLEAFYFEKDKSSITIPFLGELSLSKQAKDYRSFFHPW